MRKIRILPDVLANKIAAGEVVERPASVVKELLENALDAGAQKITIEVESGGKKLIRIRDDGEGMSRDDAITAFERHATSKLRAAEDLESITTLGFRGEALPSIAAVSRLALRTKIAGETEGTEVEFIGGKLVAVRDVAWPGGAEVEVKDLFFNVPARRKFLKSDSTESFHITNLVQHYALANPGFSFLLIRDGRDVIRVTSGGSLRERAYQVLGASLLEKLIEVDHEVEGARIFGFVSNPQEQRSSRDAQYFFVNRRFVRDQLIGRALSESYRSMMPVGTHAAAILFIEVPTTEVDVNVHPAKTEIRFLHESIIFSTIRGAVTRALVSAQPVSKLPEPRVAAPVYEPAPQPRTSFSPIVRGEPAHPEKAGVADPERFTLEATDMRDDPMAQRPLSLGFDRSPTADRPELPEARSYQSHGVCESGYESEFQPAVSPFSVLPGLGHGIKPLGQIRDSYIVATDEEGLLLVDQHVAHERVLFEQFRDQRLARAVEVQPLLIPEILDLSPAEAEAFAIVCEELEATGIETSQLSGRTVAIKSAPAGLPTPDLVGLVREVLAVVERERRTFSIEHIREEIAASLACKAAIKINMPLTPEKMQWLIDELLKTQNPMTCPHGRPIIMRFGLRDIERGFKRPV